MHRVAIIGAGQTGASAALALALKGVEVVLYSDRPRKALRDAVPPTGSAITFGKAQDAERALGLADYPEAPKLTGMSNFIVVPPDIEAIEFDADFNGFTAIGIDPRLKADDRIGKLIAVGGVFVVQRVDSDTLDDIAADFDLTMVATGKGGRSSFFPRNPSRSFYDRPQRRALMLTAKGPRASVEMFAHRGAAGAGHIVFTSIPGEGEFWISPYYHKDIGPAWTLLAWAIPGSDWDKRVLDAGSPDTTLNVMQSILTDYLPWDEPEFEDFEIIRGDQYSWLRGSVLQEVRAVMGFTKGGRAVASLGDTSIGYDPLAGQGAQSGLIKPGSMWRGSSAMTDHSAHSGWRTPLRRSIRSGDRRRRW